MCHIESFVLLEAINSSKNCLMCVYVYVCVRTIFVDFKEFSGCNDLYAD